MIDWNSSDTVVLINPRTPPELKKHLSGALEHQDKFPGHIWIATSGTSGQPKWVLLSKEAVLCSAHAVNHHLQSNQSDIWLHPLPDFHVGGLGIAARSFVSGASMVKCAFTNSRWEARQFVEQLNDSRATLTALVPAQVFDLITNRIQAPPHLRAVIVGGGAQSKTLYKEAVALGWKLLPSYGLTECASQVATAPLGSTDFPALRPLSHVKLALTPDGCLKISSDALLTAYVHCIGNQYHWHDPKVDGWLTTEDHAELDNEGINAVTRGTNFVKIGGESVDLQRLEKILEEEIHKGQFTFDVALIALPDERLGHQIHLAVASSSIDLASKLVENFRQKVLPFEAIRKIHLVDAIPRSPLGKVLKEELRRLLSASEDSGDASKERVTLTINKSCRLHHCH